MFTNHAQITPARFSEILEAAEAAARAIPPAFPLDATVAVNPFLGYVDRSFESTAARLGRVTGARALMPREWFRRHVESGRITRDDVARALELRATGGAPDALAGLDADAVLARVVAPLAARAALRGRRLLRSRGAMQEFRKPTAAAVSAGLAFSR